jgi:flagellar protein FlgJ
MDVLAPLPAAATDDTRRAALRQAALDLEGAFLAEMLKSAGFGKTRDALSGGAGEDGFASMLVDAQARAVVRGGGLGLSEAILRALMGKEGGDG